MIAKLALRTLVVAALFFGGIALAIAGHFAVGTLIAHTHLTYNRQEFTAFFGKV